MPNLTELRIFCNVTKAAAKREALAQGQREAEKQASEEAKRQREAREEERRLNAEKRKQVEFDRYQRQLEIDRQKQQQASKPKQVAPKEEVLTAPSISVPRPTFSLFGRGGPKNELTAPKTSVAAPPAKKSVPTATRGVPEISKWTLNSDNTISGFISGSSSFDDGAPVTTSPIVGSAVSGSNVRTKSSSRYFLGEEASSGGGFFSLFGGQDVAPSASVKPAPEKKKVRKAQAPDQAVEEKRRAAAEGKHSM
jgi:hypothetical protein